MKEKNIGFYHTFNETKASIVERFNRTLKQRMYWYFTWKGTLKYLDVLPEIVSAYNNSYHRSIKRTPSSVNKNNENEVWQTLYGNSVMRRPPYKFKYAFPGPRNCSKKDIYLTGAKRFFTISKRIPRNPPVYKVKEFDGDELEGTFYKQELQRVETRGDEEVYKIEKIIKKRKTRKNVQNTL